MTWLIDVDGVLADFCGHFLMAAEAVTGRTLNRQALHKVWEVETALGLTPIEEHRAYKLIRTPGTAQGLTAYPGAVEAVLQLATRRDVYFVTSPLQGAPTWVHDREAWLVKHFGQTLGRKVIHTKHKHMVGGDVLWDDSASNIKSWVAKHGPKGGLGICWSYDHNAELEGVPGVLRTRSYEEVLRAAL